MLPPIEDWDPHYVWLSLLVALALLVGLMLLTAWMR
jgi:hypothetical protein